MTMSKARIFQETQLLEGSTIILDEPASHHLARVLRVAVADVITLFNGKGGEFDGEITQITKKNVMVKIGKFIPREVESSLDLCLAQGISRGEKMDYTIQKAVELGVKKIIPLLTERCTVKLDDERRERRWQHWRSIIIHACEQSGRTRVPELAMPIALTDWLQEEMRADVAFVLAPGADKKLMKISMDPLKRAILLIGPEGGLDPEEIKIACKKGFLTLNLGPRILRTETAAVAALTALQCLYGDLCS